MPRPKRPRTIESHPETKGFSPDGMPHSGETILTIEEYEAIRLSDYLGLDQSMASEQMNVSRQTFGRILKQARYNLSEALVTGKRLRVTGGCYQMQGRGRRRRGHPPMNTIKEEIMTEVYKNEDSQDPGTPSGQGQGQGRDRGQGQGNCQGRGQGRGRGQGQGQGRGQGTGGSRRGNR